MKPEKSTSKFLKNRWWQLLVLLLLGASYFWVASESRVINRVDPSAPVVKSQVSDQVVESADATKPRATRSSLKRPRNPNSPNADDFPQVERILGDESLTEQQAAREFALMISRKELSLEERDEALAHGLNLDFSAFSALPLDSTLPTALAQRYCYELANRNDMPQQQLEGYLGLMNHPDQEISTQATLQLAFQLENDELAENPAELKRLATEQISLLKMTPANPQEAVSADPVNEPLTQ